jgi:hypothetical protein
MARSSHSTRGMIMMPENEAAAYLTSDVSRA